MRWSGKSLGADPRYRDGRFQVVRQLGSGCLGDTLEARDAATGATVAIKLLAPAGGDEVGHRERLKKEVARQKGLAHPSLCPLREELSDESFTGAVRPYALGIDLAGWIQQSESPSAQAISSLLGRLLEALAAAHEAGCTHHNLSLSNVIVGGSADAVAVRVVDLGLSRVMGVESYLKTFPESPFLAPEQRSAPSQADARADVFAVGVIGLALTEGRALSRSTPARSVPPARRAVDLPDALENLLRQATAAEPAHRFVDAGTFLTALRDAGLASRGDVWGTSDGDIEILEEIEVLEEQPRVTGSHVPPPLPPSVTGELDPMAAQRRTQRLPGPPRPSSATPSKPERSEAPVGGPSAKTTEELPTLASGWFSALSPTRPTWETSGVPRGAQEQEAAGDEAPAPSRPSSGGETVRLMVPMAGAHTDDDGDGDRDDEGSGTIRMRTPFAPTEEDSRPEEPSPSRVTSDKTTRLRIPMAEDPMAKATLGDSDNLTLGPDDATEVSPAPGRAAPETPAPAPLAVMAAEPGEFDEPEPDDDDVTEPDAAKSVVATMVMPVGRPAAVAQSQTGNHPVAPAEVSEELERRRHRAPTGDLEAAAELGAAGALDGFGGARRESAAYRPVKPRPGPGLIVPWLVFGLILGGGLGFWLGRATGASERVEIAPRERQAPATGEARHTMHPGDDAPEGSDEPAPALAVTTPEDEPEPAANEPDDDAPPGDSQAPVAEGTALGTGDQLAVADTSVEVTPEPHTPVAVAGAGPLTFAADLWEADNSWIFLYRRETPDDQPEFRELQYYFERVVESVEPAPFGTLVTLVDMGGVSQPETRQVLATASCLLDPDSLEALFCLPASADELGPATLAGQPIGVAQLETETESLIMSPSAGWFRETRVDRNGRIHEADLVGYRIGDRMVGDADREILMCDWHFELDRGDRVGRVGRDEGPEMEAAESWGLEGSLRRIDVPLVGEHGLAWLRAWHSDEQTAYQVLPDSGNPDEPLLVDPDAPVEIVDLPLDEVKVWTHPNGVLDYAALIFEGDDDTQQVRLVAVGPDGVASSELLAPSREGDARLSVVLLANPDACYVQIRRGRWQEMRHADFELRPDGPVSLGGTL